MDKTGETVLYSFTGLADGGNPAAGLIRDSAGNLYGTTVAGGGFYGTVFKVNTAGTETVLHTFRDRGGDGGLPIAGLTRDSAGNLTARLRKAADRTMEWCSGWIRPARQCCIVSQGERMGESPPQV